MINSNELRIGNRVKHEAKWSHRQPDYGEPQEFEFDWQESDWYAVGECVLFLEDISPIPLTEELLLKFGFDKSDEHQLGYIINEIGFHYDYHFKRFYLEIGDDCDLIKLENIQYIHQLQNLCHNLTGQELTINA